MSAIDHPAIPFVTAESPHRSLPENPSFKARLAQRRRELEQASTFELEVPGYEDLWARYRGIGFDEARRVGLRVEEETDDQATGERFTAAETLCVACVELLELKGLDANQLPIFESLGYKWTPAAARDVFEVDLPDGVADRDALLTIFPYPRDILMMNHFQEYMERAMGYLPQMEATLLRESPGRSAPITSD